MSSGNSPIDFDRFSLLPDQRLLLRDGAPVRLGARAFDILLALASQPGQLLSRRELIAKVWPNTFVDEVNLRVQMAALRKALGDDDEHVIRTDVGRGYRFTAPIGQGAKASSPRPAMMAAISPLPIVATRLIGRDDFVEGLVAQLRRRRLITIVGPGGIGKTRVAIASAEALAGSYRDGIGFVDLTKAAELASVATVLANALGVALGPGDLIDHAAEYLRGREMLLVIDNCEHVVHAATELVEAISAAAPGVHILATSREALRASGECVRSLPPLVSPSDAMNLNASAALTYPAVELFVERAAATGGGYQLGDTDAQLVSEICRRLDGVALAIELAAAQVDAFGVVWLAAHLSERLWLLRGGQRTAAQRHQTLAATLDWSYRLLSAHERATLQRAAVFPGAFTLQEAITVVADHEIGDLDVARAVSGLIAKSMATLDANGSVTRFRLPETTRAYATARNEQRL